MPMSGIAAAKYAQTDANFAPWYAPAGFTRGLLDTVNDVGIYPNQKQRDSLYDQANINPVAFFPSEGFVIYGQKTLQSKPSAFDRINVRRLFLYLEKRVKEQMFLMLLILFWMMQKTMKVFMIISLFVMNAITRQRL